MDLNKLIQKRFNIRCKGGLPFTNRGKAAFRNSDLKRSDLAGLFNDLGFTKGAEVGVATGKFSAKLCAANKNLRLICVDPWQRTKDSPISTDRSNKNFAATQKRLEGLNIEFKKMESMEAVSAIEDRSLDFVYIDALHDFDSVMRDIIEWSKKVKKGGIVSGHDYTHVGYTGVVEAADAYTRAHHITPWYITKDHPNSFFWVKN